MNATKKNPSTNLAQYLQHIITNLPQKPGVYRFKDASGRIIYVGKAKKLRSRVASYFQTSKDQSIKTKKMVEHITDIDYTVVGSNLEAIMLETNLIKELRPKYNILMKDDKNYVYIKITTNEDFPRIFITRKVENDKARYFGPKTAQHKVQKTLKVLKRIFPYRHCSLAIDYHLPKNNFVDPQHKHKVKVTKASIKYPCIDYHIKRCIGPCIGTVTPQEYREIINQVIRFLEGKYDEVIEKLRADMLKAATEKKFEVAAALRDKLQAIEDIMEPQNISTPNLKDIDVINYISEDEQLFFNLFQVRSGKLINQENFKLTTPEAKRRELPPLPIPSTEANPAALNSFLKQYYNKATDLPQEILIPHPIEDPEALEAWLTATKGHKVTLKVPAKGHKDKLLKLSHQNAQSFAKQSQVKWQGHQKSDRNQALQGLQKLLNLPKSPRRLECYDISHFDGTQTVSSMVVFENGFPKKDHYRKFKLHQQTPGAPNDFASMEETLTRRLKYLKPSQDKTLTVKKAPKKDITTIKLPPAPKDKNSKLLTYLITNEDKTIGHAHIIQTPTKTYIQHLELPPPRDLPALFKKIAQKNKTKRLYLSAAQNQVTSYEEVGCQLIKKVPPNLPIPKKHTALVYDVTKNRLDPSFKTSPDLIIIDGGKGQLSAAIKGLKKYKLSLPIISIAKKQEEIFIPYSKKSIILEHSNPILHLIQHLRDESHRFAITYHQHLKLKATTSSALDHITGIGERTKHKLLQHFGSPAAIKTATLYELEQLVGKKIAIQLKKEL